MSTLVSNRNKSLSALEHVCLRHHGNSATKRNVQLKNMNSEIANKLTTTWAVAANAMATTVVTPIKSAIDQLIATCAVLDLGVPVEMIGSESANCSSAIFSAREH